MYHSKRKKYQQFKICRQHSAAGGPLGESTTAGRLNRSVVSGMCNENKYQENKSHKCQLNRNVLERVSDTNYLGCSLNEHWGRTQEIKRRKEIATTTFNKIRNLLCSNKLNTKIKTRMLRYIKHIFSVIIWYSGMEPYTGNKEFL